jgi:CelD/BcsL family acetyltransferase involved in cellulose biosynthesis
MSAAGRIDNRPVAAAYRAAMLTRAELPGIAAEWRMLFHEAVEANPFCGPDFLLPLVELVDALRPLRFLALRRSADGSLAAFMPLEPRAVLHLPVQPLRSFRHPLIAGGLPLIARKDASAVWPALLDGLAELTGKSVLFFWDVVQDGAGQAALAAAAAASERPILTFNPYRRAGLRPGPAPEAYLAGLPKRMRQNLRRRERLLGEAGAWEAGHVRDPIAAADALASFLHLEAAGWKGRAGTALAGTPAGRAFAEAAFAPGNSAPGVRIDRLRRKGRTLAVALTLTGPAGAAAMKSAYDEAECRLSPGQMLDLAMTRSLLAERWTPRLDSVAQPGHPIERLWRDRVPVAHVAVGLPSGVPGDRLRLLVRLEELKLQLRATAKAVYLRLTGAHRVRMRETADSEADRG